MKYIKNNPSKQQLLPLLGQLSFCLSEVWFKSNVYFMGLSYTSLLASVRSTQSLYFPLLHGTRQGCPLSPLLSPLLFALVMETLATSICQCAPIKGLGRANMDHKMSLYGEDVHSMCVTLIYSTHLGYFEWFHFSC